MAGVVAMASVIEDFDTQPCKKSRKDGDSPVVKTITNYFSPVAKPVEKPFSPPRSNNIMDYFSRKPPSSKEKTSPSPQSKENCQTSQSTEKRSSPEAAVRQQPSQKRGRKATKAARKLVESENARFTATDSCLILDEPHQPKDLATEVISGSGFIGSDTAALLAQLSAEASATARISEKRATMAVVIDLTEKDEQPKQSPISCHNGKSKAELQCISTSSNVPLREKTNKTATKTSKKRLQEDVKQPEPEEKEAETSLCDVSMEDNEDEASDANNSTVTISFEDFLRSQGQDKGEEGSKITTEAEEINNDVLKNSSSSVEPSLQVSPRIITVQAEVHTVSPKQEPVKDVGKLASIFNKRKGTASPVVVVPSPQTEAGHQSSSSVRSVKRKSNVVLQEEDLELAVLESETTPKCSEAERKQFMAAFKRPSQDGSKTKPGKSQGKQKQPGEKNVDPAENIPEEEDVIPPAVEQVPAASQENGVTKKNLTRKGKKKAKEKNETVTTVVAASPPAEETGVTVIDVDNKEEEPTIPAVRRSRRGAVITQPPDTTIASPARKNRKQKESMDGDDAAAAAASSSSAAAAAASLPDCSENMSTPKTRRSKHGVFVAEMVGPPDMNESPIRIKFTRVNRNVSTSKAGSGSGINTSKATKTLDTESKKRKQAKKLVEKAKVMQQSKKTAAEKRSPLRRSSRYETSIKKSYCENEDSVICLEDDQSATSLKAPEKSKNRKPLRSLNDVLGKSAVKDTKAFPGSKAAMMGPEKGAPKVSTVISIFDDSSREGSENSQDDEQFKARREFLKSGLPESFRKQLAKTTATKEAFSHSSSSFQPVLHIKQLPNDCPLWSLPWPESSLLCPLKDLLSPSSSFSYVSGSFSLKTEPAQRAFCERGSGWRPEISDSVRQLLIEEVSNSNPPFPAQMFITRFLKRRTDHQQHSCTASETAPQAGGKRKRMDDGGENAVKVAKKQRGNHSDENVPKPEPTKRGGHARRGKRFEPEKEAKDKVKPADISAPILCEDESVIVLDDLLVNDTVEKDVKKEDVLWTEKYQPQHSSDIIGNTASVRRLHSWLKEWKLRADREERKNQKDKKREEGNNDSDWDCGEEDSQDAEDMLCNTILITGPTGVGKTAAVYACAQELGFKVFEVNASSQRSGRLILSQLREATQSHQVDSQGVNAHKPTYFNSYGTSSSAGTARPGFSPRKVNSPRRVVSSPRKHPQSPRAGKKGTLAPTSLVNFFKMGQPTKKDQQNTKKNEQAAASKKANNESANKKKDVTVKTSARASTPEENSEEQSKKTATSLILFEEVDVIFEEDSGFLAAVKTFMATTKRPVILTTSDPAFSTMFDGSFDEIHFKTPSELNVSTYLQLLCLAEDMRTDPANISSLLRLNGCDIRQSLLQLQFWTRSAGGGSVIKPLKHPDTSAELKPEPVGEAAEMSMCEVTVPLALPPCDTGCTESRLGLLNLEPERDIWKLFRSQSLKETVCWELLINSRRRGVDLLYTNMETLLPLPLTQLTSSICKPVSESKDHPSDIPKEQPSSDILPSHTRLMHMAESGDCSDDGSPIKVSNRMRKNKRRHGLPVQDGLYSDSDSEEGFLSLCKPQVSAQDKERVNKRAVPVKVKRKLLTAEARAKSLPVSQCLESMAEFFDNMSYLDSLLMHSEGGDVHRRTSAVSAAFKDGMTDELRVEADRESWMSGEQVLQIQAAVEALSFHKCQSSVADAWNKSQQLQGELGKEAAEELTLPVASHREGHSFSQDGPCHRQLVQRRREVMESLMLRGAVGLGNRPAAALDYLPVLRTICRSEHLKEKGKVKRRFLHYLDAIHLGLAKSTIQHLAEDFP
ncbi:ATPase family AAA domain-containing protein 5-like [Solea senegalensis]|uniref:ATPase family AAA domain-containing protein 5-like n=1 Tax=Solea senegalensis TaxID=28829 RepID=A0AAV6RG06_SOLSE|nr:ATPase family AAA domain-containing protein 5 isoform X1 [Solea senegalensis]KAG7504487.1 ATPase family AAA domain-containing protein 5-like [Solea senegalensis]